MIGIKTRTVFGDPACIFLNDIHIPPLNSNTIKHGSYITPHTLKRNTFYPLSSKIIRLNLV